MTNQTFITGSVLSSESVADSLFRGVPLVALSVVVPLPNPTSLNSVNGPPRPEGMPWVQKKYFTVEEWESPSGSLPNLKAQV